MQPSQAAHSGLPRSASLSQVPVGQQGEARQASERWRVQHAYDSVIQTLGPEAVGPLHVHEAATGAS